MSNALKWVLLLVVLGGASYLGYVYFIQEPKDEATVEEETDDEIIVDIDENLDDDTDTSADEDVDEVIEEETEDETTLPEEEEDDEPVVGNSLPGATAADNARVASYGCSTTGGVFTFEWTTNSNTGDTPAVSSATVGSDIVVTFSSLSRDEIPGLSNASSLCGTKPVVSATREGEVSTYKFLEYSAKSFELSADKANNKVYLKITL